MLDVRSLSGYKRRSKFYLSTLVSESSPTTSTPETPAPSKVHNALVRFGGVAFLFFFLKGLAWIAVFFFGWQSLS